MPTPVRTDHSEGSAGIYRGVTGTLRFLGAAFLAACVFHLVPLMAHSPGARDMEDGEFDLIAQAYRPLEEQSPEEIEAVIKRLKAEREELIEEARRSKIAGSVTLSPEEVERLAKERARLERQEKKSREDKKFRENKRLREELGVVGVETVVDRGDSVKCLDIVMVGDGWTEKDIPQYRQACAAVVKGLSDKFHPFNLFASRINFHRIDVLSEESGISTPGKPVRTVFGSSVNDNNILTTGNGQAILDRIILARDADLVINVVNHGGGRSTGGGGFITLAKSGVNETVFHEMGHAFAALGDEYSDKSQEAERDLSDIERIANLTVDPDPRNMKWHYWNIPEEIFRGRSPSREREGVVPEKRLGLFEGGAYQEKGVWRPRAVCRMKTSGHPFCEVCAEAMEKRLFYFVPVLDDISPGTFRNTLFADEKIQLSVRPMTVEPQALARLDARSKGDAWEMEWYLDGRRAGDGRTGQEGKAALVVHGSRLSAGVHTVTCQLDHVNPRVRRDGGLLTGSATWEIDVLPCRRPKIEIPARRFEAKPGEPLVFSVASPALPDGSGLVFEAMGLPPGASFRDGTFSWVPGDGQHGAYQLSFAVARLPRVDRLTGIRLVEALQAEIDAMRHWGSEWAERQYRDGNVLEILHCESVRIDVARPEKASNRPPRIVFQELPDGREGELLSFRILAHDPDGDHLLFEAKSLPAGARLDPNTGEFEWIPSLTQSGTFPGIEIQVRDGDSSDKRTFSLEIADRPLTPSLGQRVRGEAGEIDPQVFGRSSDIVLGLRSPSVRLRMVSLEYLARYPAEMQIRELARLLRDDVPGIRDGALARLRALVPLPFPEGRNEAAGRRSPGYRTGDPPSPADEREEDGPLAPFSLRMMALLQALATEKGSHAWKLVDAPEVLEWVHAVCEAAASMKKEIPGAERKMAQRIGRDVAAACDYSTRRRESPDRLTKKDKQDGGALGKGRHAR